MPIDPDELAEIKKLLDDSLAKTSSTKARLWATEQESGETTTPKTPEAEQDGSAAQAGGAGTAGKIRTYDILSSGELVERVEEEPQTTTGQQRDAAQRTAPAEKPAKTTESASQSPRNPIRARAPAPGRPPVPRSPAQPRPQTAPPSRSRPPDPVGATVPGRPRNPRPHDPEGRAAPGAPPTHPDTNNTDNTDITPPDYQPEPVAKTSLIDKLKALPVKIFGTKRSKTKKTQTGEPTPDTTQTYEDEYPQSEELPRSAMMYDDRAAPGKDTHKHAETAADYDTGPEKFKLKFDFDGEYIDAPVDKPFRLRRERRTGCVGGVLYAAFVICVSVVLASLAWMAASDVLGFGTADEQVNITVPANFDFDDIIEKLYEAGLIRYKFLFKIYSDYSKAEEKISAGSYVLNKNYDYRAIIHGMTARGGVLVETTVTIPEGFTMAEIFARLEENGVCLASDLWEAATNHDFQYAFLDKETLGDKHRLEGFLFPETYNFYLNSSPVQVLSRFLNEFRVRFTETYIERAEDMGYTIREILTVASMIEREAGSDEERPRIAAVIYNRLKSSNFPMLEIDATINYVIAGTDRPWSLDIDSPYNTYTHEGLPPGPIANPGIESIRAALYPESTNEYYYALNKLGTHAFFRTYEQHRAFVASDDYGGRQ